MIVHVATAAGREPRPGQIIPGTGETMALVLPSNPGSVTLSVTHIGSGCSIREFDSVAEAMQFANDLWDKLSLAARERFAAITEPTVWLMPDEAWMHAWRDEWQPH